MKLVPLRTTILRSDSTLSQRDHSGPCISHSDIQETPNCGNNRNLRSHRIRIPRPRRPSSILLCRSGRTGRNNDQRSSCAHRFNRRFSYRSHGLPGEPEVLEALALMRQPIAGFGRVPRRLGFMNRSAF